jgi:hypothetical protein
MVTKLGPRCRVKLLKNYGDKLVERTEKAGVGGSTPCLATIVCSLTYECLVLKTCSLSCRSTKWTAATSKSEPFQVSTFTSATAFLALLPEAAPGGGDESYRRCRCWKHLRWHGNGTPRREATKCRDWAGAERAKQDLLKRMEAAAFGFPVRRETALAQAGELYIADKLQQGLKGNTISKNKRTIDRLAEFLERKEKVSLDAITPNT